MAAGARSGTFEAPLVCRSARPLTTWRGSTYRHPVGCSSPSTPCRHSRRRAYPSRGHLLHRCAEQPVHHECGDGVVGHRDDRDGDSPRMMHRRVAVRLRGRSNGGQGVADGGSQVVLSYRRAALGLTAVMPGGRRGLAEAARAGRCASDGGECEPACRHDAEGARSAAVATTPPRVTREGVRGVVRRPGCPREPLRASVD
jgi:hypothetical protein